MDTQGSISRAASQRPSDGPPPMLAGSTVHNSSQPEGVVQSTAERVSSSSAKPATIPKSELPPRTSSISQPIEAVLMSKTPSKDQLDRLNEKHEQARAIKQTPNDVLERQLDRVLIARKKEEGEKVSTLVPGINDSVLWTLRRRFDIQVCHVLSPPLRLPEGQYDLRPTTLPAVPFRANIMKSNTERVFATVVFKGFIFAREMRRIMLWTPPERPRTLAFCVAYTILWILGLLIPGLVLFLILLILYPPARTFFFPQAVPDPDLPVPGKTPTAKASFLLSVPDPAMYADKLELLEDYAIEGGKIGDRFFRRLAAGGFVAGDDENGDVGRKYNYDDIRHQKKEEDSGIENGGDFETHKEEQGTDTARAKFDELERKEQEWGDEERDILASKLAKIIQDILGMTADAVEILQNALSPPTPFPKNSAAKRLAAALLPLVIIVPLTPAWIISYGFGAIFGLAFFGQPLLMRAAEKFVELVPDWQDYLNLRDTIFSGVPTDMQLTLHLLRINEAHHHPLPPPPDLPTDVDVKRQLDDTDVLSEDGSEIDDLDAAAGIIVNEDETVDLKEDHDQAEKEDAEGGKKKGIKNALKKAVNRVTGKGGETLGQTRQRAGEQADLRFFHSKAPDHHSKSSYPCKFGKASGYATIRVSPIGSSTLTFTPLDTTDDESVSPPSFELDDLVEIKKLGVSAKRDLLGKVANIDMEGKGLEMRFKTSEERKKDRYGQDPRKENEDIEGRKFLIEAVHRRDELFGRLISIPANTRWESL